MKRKISRALFVGVGCTVLVLGACSNPQSGPDKTIGGAVLGGAWGAGAGAVVGNQITNNSWQGAGMGAGFGAVSGAMVGAGYDLGESVMLDQEQELASLKLQNATTEKQISHLQARLDSEYARGGTPNVYQVFFDSDETNLRAGTLANLENIAETIKRNPHAYTINVVGHSDDSGDPEYNERIAEARARTVSAYLASRGISSDQIAVKSFGSKRPVAPNNSPTGRQLNRRVDIYITQ